MKNNLTTEQRIKNLGKYATKGNVPWNKGKTNYLSPEARKKMGDANRGKKLSKQAREHLRQLRTGAKLSDEAKLRVSSARKKLGSPWLVGARVGSKSHFWKGGITKANELERQRFYRTTVKSVLERDDYTCQLCGDNNNLQVDHIQSWAEYVELRFSMDNCRTLCAKCHYEITFNKPMPESIKAWGHNFLKRGGELNYGNSNR